MMCITVADEKQKAVLTIFLLSLQSVMIAQMLSIGGTGIHHPSACTLPCSHSVPHLTCYNVYKRQPILVILAELFNEKIKN